MVWEGIFSSLYHICPSKVNYQVHAHDRTRSYADVFAHLCFSLGLQFDTTFMVIGTGLMFVTVFQKRHPTTAPGAVRAFVFFALLILISFLALTDIYVEMYVATQHAHAHEARTDDSFACPAVCGRSPSRCSSLRV